MSKIVSVHSFRGGTGKSNVTANLATIIARSGQRVGIVDTDIQSPGIHVLFGLNEDKIGYTLNDYLWGRCAIEDAAYDVTPLLKTSHKGAAIRGSIYLIPSSIKTGEISRILREGYDARLLNEGLGNLSRRLKLDYLLIDTHPGINEETLLSIILSNVLVIILRPDHQDYQGTAVTVDVARKLEVPKMLLVVNKVLPAINFGVLEQQVQRTYNTTVASILPVSEEMFQLGSSDVFSLCYPNHPWTQGVSAIAKHIVQNKITSLFGQNGYLKF
ncbi:cobyrinic acid a,c-diamide synthase [Scytonema sp. HK-05]|uniref:MinD/ParA family ATP-binding protein n=1 Tax=Scytonema sp. HK-05 TaxID=1137095 RepID=UPI000935D27D|nr:MinD/ParA family protein [Scytonema sp. HK-05]OKH60014.1 CDP-3,6-dideoxy-D-glycero-L-glycero-4-hexulose-4-reductase [Scytonema sp. HK-05]BAY42702.1 cobyrinic acid a,c-diamide synthase [Scytonema sp. HK-05]